MKQKPAFFKSVIQRSKPGIAALRPQRPIIGQPVMPEAPQFSVPFQSPPEPSSPKSVVRKETVDPGSVENTHLTVTPKDKSERPVNQPKLESATQMPPIALSRMEQEHIAISPSTLQPEPTPETHQQSTAQPKDKPQIEEPVTRNEMPTSDETAPKLEITHIESVEHFQIIPDKNPKTSSIVSSDPDLPVSPPLDVPQTLTAPKLTRPDIKRTEPRNVSVFAKSVERSAEVAPKEQQQPLPLHKKPTRPIVEIGTVEVRVVNKRTVAPVTPEPVKQIKPPATAPTNISRPSLAVYGWRQS